MRREVDSERGLYSLLVVELFGRCFTMPFCLIARSEMVAALGLQKEWNVEECLDEGAGTLKRQELRCRARRREQPQQLADPPPPAARG